jgi:uncharacterized membrane protein YraQ (UPF0718 family)
MAPATIVLLACVTFAFALAYVRGADMPLRALQSSSNLLHGVWLELALGFLLAGLLDVLIPQQAIVRGLGGGDARAILLGSVVGLALPGGPYVLFPIAARLLGQGAAPGAVVALVTAKTLISPIRALTFEVPLLGWPLTLARLLPSLLVPPLLGFFVQWLSRLFSAPPAP